MRRLILVAILMLFAACSEPGGGDFTEPCDAENPCREPFTCQKSDYVDGWVCACCALETGHCTESWAKYAEYLEKGYTCD